MEPAQFARLSIKLDLDEKTNIKGIVLSKDETMLAAWSSLKLYMFDLSGMKTGSEIDFIWSADFSEHIEELVFSAADLLLVLLPASIMVLEAGSGASTSNVGLGLSAGDRCLCISPHPDDKGVAAVAAAAGGGLGVVVAPWK